MGQTGTMRALIALLCWLALSAPLALLVSRLIGTAGSTDGVGDEAERWLRSLVPPRHRVRDAVLRSALAVLVLAPVAVGGLAAVWRLPDAVTVARADGQLALAWPPGQPDETTTTTTAAPTAPAAAADDGGVVEAASAEPGPTVSPEATTPDPPAPTPSGEPAPLPSDAGGDHTGAPAVVDDAPDRDGDRERDDDRCDTSGKGGRDERCGDGDDDPEEPAEPDEPGDGEEDDGGEPTTTTTEPPPPAPDDGGDDDDPVSPVPYRSTTALLTGFR